jgi:predicted nucleic acid-binding protein
MIVVSDTSPLNYLVLIGHDAVLPALFDRVLTTPGVIAELSHRDSPEGVRRWAATPPSWLGVRAPSSIDAALQLGRGETEAISLARELHADGVLMDERRGTLVARGLGLRVTGTLGVVQLAGQRGLLDITEAVSSLRRTTFRASDALYDRLLRPHPEGPSAGPA